MRASRFLPPLLLGLAVAGSAAAWPWDRKDDAPRIPRWGALKFGEVNARAGPGEDTRVLFVYRSRGLPVQILAETREWRRVCDSDRTMVWVKATAVTERRTVLRKAAQSLPLRAAPAPGAKVAAVMAGRSVAELKRQHGSWIEVKAGGRTGWAPAAELWGTDNRPQCR
jgi:SH3-like domain-containing protein